MVAAVWTLLVALEPVVRLAGGGLGCPTLAEVDTKLKTLLPAAAAGSSRDIATLDELDRQLRVTLRRSDGTMHGPRDFERNHSCDDLASAIALVIATWESDVHPEFLLALPPERASTEPPAERLAKAEAIRPPPPVVRVSADATPKAPPLAVRPAAFDLGAALIAEGTPNRVGDGFQSDLALAVGLVAGWMPRGPGLGARLAVGADTERTLPLAVGEARWRRVTAALGPDVRWRFPRRGGVDVHGEALVAAMRVRGSGFATNGNDWTLDLGAAAGVRLLLGTGRWRPWLDFSVAGWPRKHIVYVQPTGEGASIPPVEGLLSMGVGLFGAAAGPP